MEEAIDEQQHDIDPVTLEVLWSRLQDVPEQMGTSLRRTAFSEVIKYNVDFSTALFGWDGRLISQGIYSPGHLGSMPFAMEKVLDEHFAPADFEPGDVVITNDPEINAGHLPDFTVFYPVFHEESLVGFCGVMGHQMDIGGSAPGSMMIHSDDLYDEGLQLPPIKIVKGGTTNDEVMDIIEENSRVPDKITGDVEAHFGASQVGAERYKEIIDDYGFETIKRYTREIMSRSETSMRKAIEEVPDGTHTFIDHMDGIEGGERLPIHVELTISDDEITVDLDGTADQLASYAINSTLTYTRAYIVMAIKSAVDPDTPQTQGSMEPVIVEAPEGTFVSPKMPAPVASRHIVSNRVVNVVNGALHEALPEKVPAAGSELYLNSQKFVDEETGEDEILVDNSYGGAGARHDRDGYPAVAAGSNVRNVPVEVIEKEYPLRINSYELVTDSAGHGKQRGGSGTVREYEYLQDATVVFINDRYESAPYGLEGGHPGRKGKAILDPDSSESKEFYSKQRASINAGSILRVHLPGGGGYGEPEGRDFERVVADVENGLISPDIAAEIYGVEINGTDSHSPP